MFTKNKIYNCVNFDFSLHLVCNCYHSQVSGH